MTFGKRQLVIAAMVTALGTAVYLNWQFSGVEPVSVNDTPSSISTSKQLGQTTYVNTEVSNAESSKKPESCSKTASSKTEKETQSSKVKQTVSENKSNLTKEQQEYFSSERAKRSQSQDKATEALTDIIESASSSETAKNDALKIAEKLADNIKAESDIEAEIKTKGFAECLVSINNNNCTVIVSKGNLNEATAITVKDIVYRHANIDFDKITVTEI